MPIVLVHGVPDTHRVWDKVRGELTRTDAVTVSLPGFGCSLPPGFSPTKEGYSEWLAEELGRIGTGLDVVGHDWGCLLVLRALMLRPELFRSWVVGGAPLDPSYVWHQAAKLWQTPQVGEQVMAATNPKTMPPALMAAGVPKADAELTASFVDDTMKQCILSLYRSAVHVGREWGPALSSIRTPGLVLWGEQDPYAEVKFGKMLAGNAGAEFALIPGCSHWWPLEKPADVARAMEAFWSRLA